MEFDEDDLALSQDRRPASSRGVSTRPTTSGGMAARPVTGAGRPMSRRGSAVGGVASGQATVPRPFSRQGSALGARAGTALTGGSRLGSAMHRSAVPGTASRLQASALQNRPLSSRGGIGLQTPVQVADRPITQQGLSGIRTGVTGTSSGRGPQRQIQDKSYFIGALRAKMSELGTELNHMKTEINAANEEQSTFLTYDKRVKETAAELTELQATLADYNLLVDKLNTDTEVVLINQEYQELAAQNELESKDVDSIFAEKQTREIQIKQLEQELDQERHMADNLVSAMQPSLRGRYVQLKNQNVEYQSSLERMNQELDSLNSRKATLEDEVALSALKKEALTLYDNLREVERKRDELLDEEKNRGTPAQERERLLNQVKEDNAEIATMEQQISEMQEQISRLNEEMTQLEQDLEENQSERNVKYRDLRKREDTMDQFLATFEMNRGQELERCSELQKEIDAETRKMSKGLLSVGAGNLPSRTEFNSMKDDLAFREGEITKSKNTLEGLAVEHSQLKLNLEKIEALEDKIRTEMETLKTKMNTMDEELQVYKNLEQLRSEAHEKRALLESEHLTLGARKVAAAQNTAAVQERHNTLLRALAENETAIQLTNLEKKWSHLEQNNFAVSEFIANKKAETSFEPVRNKVLKMQWNYNKMLIENVKNHTSY